MKNDHDSSSWHKSTKYKGKTILDTCKYKILEFREVNLRGDFKDSLLGSLD